MFWLICIVVKILTDTECILNTVWGLCMTVNAGIKVSTDHFLSIMSSDSVIAWINEVIWLSWNGQSLSWGIWVLCQHSLETWWSLFDPTILKYCPLKTLKGKRAYKRVYWVYFSCNRSNYSTTQDLNLSVRCVCSIINGIVEVCLGSFPKPRLKNKLQSLSWVPGQVSKTNQFSNHNHKLQPDCLCSRLPNCFSNFSIPTKGQTLPCSTQVCKYESDPHRGGFPSITSDLLINKRTQIILVLTHLGVL